MTLAIIQKLSNPEESLTTYTLPASPTKASTVNIKYCSAFIAIFHQQEIIMVGQQAFCKCQLYLLPSSYENQC